MGEVQQPDGSYLSREVTPYGTILWFNEHRQIHREDGPAAIRPNGRVSWFLNDKEYNFHSWLNTVNIPDEVKMMLRLQYG